MATGVNIELAAGEKFFNTFFETLTQIATKIPVSNVENGMDLAIQAAK